MSIIALFLGIAGLFRGAPAPAQNAVLAIAGPHFTLGGEPRFLLGASLYGALGAEPGALRRDLDELERHGFNWIRVWATWAAFGNDVSAVDGATGRARAPYLGRLVALVADCERRGMVVDVSLSRGNGVTGPPRLQSLEAHRRAVEALVGALGTYRNWYLDLGNERNIRDPRHVTFEELRELGALARRLAPRLLVTASHAGDIAREDFEQYLRSVEVDFIAPHRPRNAASAAQTAAATERYLGWMREIGRVVPVHYQEPFRRGFGAWNPSASDFLLDAGEARRTGAAGWCFHNGDVRAAAEGRPRRSFDLRDASLFDQLDAEEKKVIEGLAALRRD